MLGLTSATVSGITAPAIAIALSPIPAVIVLVLLVHNPRPRASSFAYLLGRSTALTVLAAASVNIPSLDAHLKNPFPRWTHWVSAALGIGFISLGVAVWRRHRRPTTATPSRWHRDVGGIPPAAAAALGLLPACVNPKTVAASILAGGHIRALPSALDTATATAYYVVTATATVAVPVIAYLALGSRIDPKLERARHWIQRHHTAATAATLMLIGMTILVYGIN